MEKDDVLEELVELVGADAAQRLYDYYSGSSLYFAKRTAIRLKHQKIKEEFKGGASYQELARRYDYAEVHIRRIVHPKKLDKAKELELW